LEESITAFISKETDAMKEEKIIDVLVGKRICEGSLSRKEGRFESSTKKKTAIPNGQTNHQRGRKEGIGSRLFAEGGGKSVLLLALKIGHLHSTWERC